MTAVLWRLLGICRARGCWEQTIIFAPKRAYRAAHSAWCAHHLWERLRRMDDGWRDVP